jgi:hypothetical protein
MPAVNSLHTDRSIPSTACGPAIAHSPMCNRSRQPIDADTDASPRLGGPVDNRRPNWPVSCRFRRAEGPLSTGSCDPGRQHRPAGRLRA